MENIGCSAVHQSISLLIYVAVVIQRGTCRKHKIKE